MEKKTKGPLMTILEAAAIFALSMFLLRLGICYLSQIWWVLLILVVLTVVGIIGWRWWKNRHQDY